jgi:hypothetical protein
MLDAHLSKTNTSPQSLKDDYPSFRISKQQVMMAERPASRDRSKRLEKAQPPNSGCVTSSSPRFRTCPDLRHHSHPLAIRPRPISTQQEPNRSPAGRVGAPLEAYGGSEKALRSYWGFTAPYRTVSRRVNFQMTNAYANLGKTLHAVDIYFCFQPRSRQSPKFPLAKRLICGSSAAPGS